MEAFVRLEPTEDEEEEETGRRRRRDGVRRLGKIGEEGRESEKKNGNSMKLVPKIKHYRIPVFNLHGTTLQTGWTGKSSYV